MFVQPGREHTLSVTGTALVRRRSDGVLTPGRCANLDYCSIGMQRVLVAVPVGQPFTCPECGSALRPPNMGRERPWVMPLFRLVVLAIGIGIGFAQGYLIGRVQPAVVQGLRTLPQRAVQLARAPAPAAPVSPPARPVEKVVERPFPARAMPLDATDPAPHLAREQRFGQVTIDCFLRAFEKRPSCHVGDVRGADAFSHPALDWLQSYDVEYLPGTEPAGPDHRWRIIFQDFDGVSKN